MLNQCERNRTKMSVLITELNCLPDKSPSVTLLTCITYMDGVLAGGRVNSVLQTFLYRNVTIAFDIEHLKLGRTQTLVKSPVDIDPGCQVTTVRNTE